MWKYQGSIYTKACKRCFVFFLPNSNGAISRVYGGAMMLLPTLNYVLAVTITPQTRQKLASTAQGVLKPL